jgi:hypothetical protein
MLAHGSEKRRACVRLPGDVVFREFSFRAGGSLRRPGRPGVRVTARRAPSILALLFAVLAVPTAQEIVIADFESTSDQGTGSPSDLGERLTVSLHAELRQRSGGGLSYRPVSELPHRGVAAAAQAATVTSDLEALALCVSYNVNYVMYGSVTAGADGAGYEAVVNLYSREKHAGILQVRHAAAPASLRAFAAGLAAETHRQVLRTVLLSPGAESVASGSVSNAGAGAAAGAATSDAVQSPPAVSPQVAPAQPPPAGAAAAAAQTVPQSIPPAGTSSLQSEGSAGKPQAASTEYNQGVKGKTPAKKPGAETAETQNEGLPGTDQSQPERTLGLGLHVAAGYYIAITEEWKDAAAPRASTDAGFKLARRLFAGENTELWLRPYLIFNYSFASNRPNDLVTHHHSLSPRVGAELAAVGYGRFNFVFGTGIHYRVDIIDYQTPIRDFVIDISYAPGVVASAGVEFLLDREGSLVLGLTNLADLTFFEDRRLRNAFLLGLTFYRGFTRKQS